MGAASDRYGRKPIFLFNTALYALCCFVTAFSHDIWFFIVFRFLTGIFYGGMSGPAFLLLSETVKREYLAQLSTGAMASKFLALRVFSFHYSKNGAHHGTGSIQPEYKLTIMK